MYIFFTHTVVLIFALFRILAILRAIQYFLMFRGLRPQIGQPLYGLYTYIYLYILQLDVVEAQATATNFLWGILAIHIAKKEVNGRTF